MVPYQISSESRPAVSTVVRTATLSVDDMTAWLAETYIRVTASLAAQGQHPAGPPFARYHQIGIGRFEVEAGFPVAAPLESRADQQLSDLPGGMVAVTMHRGSFANIAPGYQAVAEWITAHGGQPSGDPWEVYFSDPKTQPDPVLWRTQIVQPYRTRVYSPAPG